MSKRPALALAIVAAACTPAAEPVQRPSPAAGSIVAAAVTMRDDFDLVAAVQRRLLSPPPLPGRVKGHGWAGERLYTIEIEGSCAAGRPLVEALDTLLRANGATTTRCVAASSFAPDQPIGDHVR